MKKSVCVFYACLSFSDWSSVSPPPPPPTRPAWSSHYKWADCLRVNVGSLLLAALACAFTPQFKQNYNLTVLAGGVFGMCSGRSFNPSSNFFDACLALSVPLPRLKLFHAPLLIFCSAIYTASFYSFSSSTS